MPRNVITKFLNPWSSKRREEQRRLEALRQRDGDKCCRCRRAIRFEAPRGHDLAPIVERLGPALHGKAAGLDGLCLTHTRCTGQPVDHTAVVSERVQAKLEAEAKRRKSAHRRKAA
jgi:hypothetical protein